MSTRRSSRREAPRSSSKIQPSIRRGLESIVNGNESYISKILSLKIGNDDDDMAKNILVGALEDCMKMNHLTAEMLLARFFDDSVLSQYSIDILHKSGKGSASTLAARIAKEWSKNDFHSSVSSNKRKRNEEVGELVDQPGKEQDDDDCEDDWREPLFFWKGALEKKDDGALLWRGSWASGLAECWVPDEKEFKLDEKNRRGFAQYGKIPKDAGDISRMSTSKGLPSLFGLGGQFQGTYMLDQGDGYSSFSDLAHYFQFHTSTSKSDTLLITAAGNTPFGQFVSAGYVTCQDNNESVNAMELILARRYIGKNDSRYEKCVNKKVSETTRKTLMNCSLKPRLEIMQSIDTSEKSFWATVLPRKASIGLM